MNTNYVFYSDPGHGWLAVSVEELQQLGIADKITSYSYLSGDGSVAYLEEDQDMRTFRLAKGWETWPNTIKEIYQKDTFIRRLPRYAVEVLA